MRMWAIKNKDGLYWSLVEKRFIGADDMPSPYVTRQHAQASIQKNNLVGCSVVEYPGGF